MDLKIAIIGGGISGLAAGYELLESGENDFCILEAQARPGGVIATGLRGEYLLEFGPDMLLPHPPAAIELARALGLGSDLQPVRINRNDTFILHANRLAALPEGWQRLAAGNIRAAISTSLLSWSTKVRMGWEFLAGGLNKRPHRTPDESVGAFLARLYGPEFVERVADPLLGAIFQLRPEEASLQALFPHIRELAAHGSVGRALWREERMRKQQGHVPAGPLSPRAGMESLIHALAQYLGPDHLWCNTGISMLTREASHYRLQLQNGIVFRCAQVILAMPAWHAAEVLPMLDAELAEALGQIRSTSVQAVYLGYRTAPDLPPGTTIMLPQGSGLGLRACTFVHRKCAGRAPEGGGLLRVALNAEEGEQADADQVLERTRKNLQTLFGLSSDPELVWMYRQKHATPRLLVGHPAHVQRVRSLAQRHPHLHLACNGLAGASVPSRIQAGREAARRVVRGLA